MLYPLPFSGWISLEADLLPIFGNSHYWVFAHAWYKAGIYTGEVIIVIALFILNLVLPW